MLRIASAAAQQQIVFHPRAPFFGFARDRIDDMENFTFPLTQKPFIKFISNSLTTSIETNNTCRASLHVVAVCVRLIRCLIKSSRGAVLRLALPRECAAENNASSCIPRYERVYFSCLVFIWLHFNFHRVHRDNYSVGSSRSWMQSIGSQQAAATPVCTVHV